MTTRAHEPSDRADRQHATAADLRRAHAPTAPRSADLEAHAALAANALARSDSPLPHKDRIAAAFGAYAVDDIRATVGGPAATTAAQLGARAFTVGDRIGFRTEPDLHLAAHEAAHTVQQRRGIQLGSADGRGHDRYEHHADAVANAVVAGHSAEPLLSATPRGPATLGLQLDEDDIDIGFEYTIRPFESRDFYASRGEIPRRIGSGPDAITVDFANSAHFDMNDAASGQVMPTAQPLDLSTFGHPHPIPATLGMNAPSMPAEQMQLRLSSLYAVLTQIGERAGKVDVDAPGLILGAQAVLRWASSQLGPSPVPLPEFSLFDPSDLVPTEPAELSRQIVRSETVLDRVYESLVELAGELQQEEITGGAIAQLAPAHAGTSYDLPDIRGRFMVQRWRYFSVANRVLESRIVGDFNLADESHGELDKYLLDQKLAYYQAIQPATKSKSDSAMASELRAWASAVAADVAWVRETAPKLRAAREANQPDTALEAQFTHKAQLIALSIEALGEFDMVVTAYEALRSANAVSGYNDLWLLWGRIDDMRTAAHDEDVDYLQLLLRKHQEDPNVRKFYESIPDRQATGIILTVFASLIIGLALGLIAGILAWGVGLAFMATIGLVVTSALGESIVVLSMLFLVRTGLMALMFTMMSRALESAVYGTMPVTPFWKEFLWNWGLFIVMEGVNFALKGTLKALGNISRVVVSMATNFTILQLYGFIRGSIDHGRFMTGEEVLMMTVQNLVMVVGMTAGMKIFEPMMAEAEGAVALRGFRVKFGGEFDAIAADRAALEADVRQRLQNDPNASEASVKDLRDRAEGIDARLKELVERVVGDSAMDLPRVRQEAAGMLQRASRMSVTQLLRSKGLPATLEFLPTGADGAYSFPRGRAEDVRAFFAGDDSYHFKEVKTDGDKVFEVTVPGKGRVQLVESPTAERVVVPLTETELATARGEIAQDVAARDAVAGGTRGRAAYQITETPGQDLSSVSRAMHQMAPGLASEGIALDGMAQKGVEVDGTVGPDAALTGTLRVTSGKASTTADVTIDVVANIDLQAPASLSASVHEGEAGYAKLAITPNGKGGWDVRISLDGRLGSEVDVQIHMRHELREAAGILVDLAKDPSLGAAHVAEQQGAGIFQPGTETAVTHHGRAAVGELADVFAELDPAVRGYEEARKEVLAGGGKRARAQRDAGEVAIRRLDAALDSLGFSDPATRPAKTQALLDTLGAKPDSPIGRYISDYGARTDAAIPRRAALDRISADRAAVDAKLGPDLAAHVAERAPAAAIDPLAQAVRAGNGELATDLVREHAGGRLDDDALVGGLSSITEPAPLKEWDDPSVTFEEFRAAYRARNPFKRGNLDDAQLRTRYDDGKRYNPATDRLANPDQERPDFEKSKETMAKNEAKKRAAFADDATKPKPATEFDDELAEMEKAGLTKNDVGALRKWSRLYEKLRELAARVGAKIPSPKQLLEGLGRNYKRPEYDAFRHRLNDVMRDLVLGRSEPEGSVTRTPADQAKLLRELLGTDLDLFPDSGSKGAFYNKYNAARFSEKSGDIYLVKDVGLKFDNPTKIELEKDRFGDAAIHVKNQTAKRGPGDGEYAFDGKAGQSRTPKQLEDVNKLVTDDGIMMGGQKKKGVIYWCENKTNAEALVEELTAIDAHKNVHVAFMDEQGEVQWLR